MTRSISLARGVNVKVAALVPLHAADAPELVKGMQSHAPAGPFEGSDGLDRAFSASGYNSVVALDPATRTLVLSGVFE